MVGLDDVVPRVICYTVIVCPNPTKVKDLKETWEMISFLKIPYHIS